VGGKEDMAKKKEDSQDVLKGWAAIAKFLSQPTSSVQRWSNEGMPVKKIGRYVEASAAELERWLGQEAGTGAPVHIPTANADLMADLKRGLAEARGRKKKK